MNTTDADKTVCSGDYLIQLDAKILQDLIDAHGAALAMLARQWCRDPEDAVQDALIDLVRQQPIPNNPVAWLYTAVRRRAMNLARAEGRREKHQRQASEQREPWFLPPENAFEAPIDYESLLARLPRIEREIVVARIWGELSFAQIAELVDQPLSTVHRRYQQALAELADTIKQLEQQRAMR